MLINSFLLTQNWFSVAASDVVKSGSFSVELDVECCDTSLLVTSIWLGPMQTCCSPDKSKIDKFVGKSSENRFIYVLLLLDYKPLQPMDDRTSYYSSLNIMKSWRQHHMQNCRKYSEIKCLPGIASTRWSSRVTIGPPHIVSEWFESSSPEVWSPRPGQQPQHLISIEPVHADHPPTSPAAPGLRLVPGQTVLSLLPAGQEPMTHWSCQHSQHQNPQHLLL